MINIEVCDGGQEEEFPDAAAHHCVHRIAAGFKGFQDVEKMWGFGFSFCFFLITGCSLARLLLLDSVQISPTNDAISVCQCEHPLLFTAGHSKSRALATTIWCSEEPSRCLMTSASLRINMDCQTSRAPPPLDASGPVCCCAVLWGSWRTFLTWLMEVCSLRTCASS